LSLETAGTCYHDGDLVAAEIWMLSVAETVVGGQFFLEYDHAKLELNGVEPGDAPFTVELYECSIQTGGALPQCDSEVGEVDYAVCVPDGVPGADGTAKVAVLTFTALEDLYWEEDLITWRTHTPPSMLSSDLGLPITPLLLPLDLVDGDSDGDGIVDCIDLCPDTPPGTPVNPDGCPDCNSNGISDACDLDCGEPGGPCDVPGCGQSLDCDSNDVPDECETDCNTSGLPELTLGVNDSEAVCVSPGEPVTVGLSMSCLPTPLAGYQAFLSFDPGALNLMSAHYSLPDPFGLPLIDPIMVVGGDIDLAAGVDDPAGQLPAVCPDGLATLEFTTGATQGATQVVFRSHDPPTRFSDEFGSEVLPILVDSPAIVIAQDPVGCEDCNSNGVFDLLDIEDGTSLDCQPNGVPDECEWSDPNGDGNVDLWDFAGFQVCLGLPGPLEAACCLFDFEPDGDVDLDDYAEFALVFTGPF
jgi:hypothetical protein